MRSSRLKFLVDVGVGKGVEFFLYHSAMDHCGVLLLRLEDATGSEKREVVANILARHSADIVNRFCVFQNGRLRIRRIGR